VSVGTYVSFLMPRRSVAFLVALAFAVVPASTGADAPDRTIFHIVPGGTGEGDDWDSAGGLDDLPAFIARAEPGDEVWIRGDLGPYETDKSLSVAAGGSAHAPVVVRGVAADGSRTATPEIVGTRSSPFDPDGDAGTELFRLEKGADHLTFTNLAFADHGNGVFRIPADIRDLSLTDMRASNVTRFVEDYASDGGGTATVTGLLIEQVEVRGYSKSAIRLRYDTNDVVIRDVLGDAERQDPGSDDFSIGVHLDDTVHDVWLERVTMRNNVDPRGEDEYWNGDGFAAEGATYGITLRDTLAAGNSDAGYDLKSDGVTLIRPHARGNMRNYRFWGRATAFGCHSATPTRHGGTGSTTDVWVGDDAEVRLLACVLSDGTSSRPTFDMGDRASLTHLYAGADRRVRIDAEDTATVRQVPIAEVACTAGAVATPLDAISSAFYREISTC